MSHLPIINTNSPGWGLIRLTLILCSFYLGNIVSSPGPPVMITENADYDDGIFHINFPPSTTPNVRYECNCTSDTCQKVIVENNLASLRASASFSGVCHNVCVCAINTCGDESPPICRKLCLRTTHGKLSLGL